MVKILFQPFEELVIKEYAQYAKPEDLVSSLFAAPGMHARIFWAEGVLFTPMALPPATERVAEEYVRGRIYWSSVSFALMPEYTSTIKTLRGTEVGIIDVSPNSLLRQAAAWLKSKATRAEAPQSTN